MDKQNHKGTSFLSNWNKEKLNKMQQLQKFA